jgi:hypothetical protein
MADRLLSPDIAVTDPIAERALALVRSSPAGSAERAQAVQELAGAGDFGQLERAREVLVRRIYQRSDDYDATAALSLLNKALAAVGWQDPYSWKHRRKP